MKQVRQAEAVRMFFFLHSNVSTKTNIIIININYLPNSKTTFYLKVQFYLIKT